MGVLTLCSAGGSPGVTTLGVGLALAWPRPVVLVEADPTGASGVLPGYLQGRQVPQQSVIDLAIAHQQGRLADAVLAAAVPFGADSQASLIPAVRSHRQAAAMAGTWEPLLDALHGLAAAGVDVLLDAGRLGLEACPLPAVTRASLALLVTRSTLPAVATARVWAPWLAEMGVENGVAAGLAVVGGGRPYPAREVGRYLKLPVLAEFPFDAAGARPFAEGTASRRWRRSPLARALRSEAKGLAEQVAAREVVAV
ncbi:MAG: hypothetical protein LBR33_12795 [Propionibacteriaceae bacterium]|jgi:hypothetical protein|nr:hypothetical protein [Propionibacteriaceae bacterium]